MPGSLCSNHHVITPQNVSANSAPPLFRVSVTRKSYGAAYCPKCGHRSKTFRKLIDILSSWDHRAVRMVVLTVDPSRYPDPNDVLKGFHKGIGYFIQKVNRKLRQEERRAAKRECRPAREPLQIIGYTAQIEFHEETRYPHAHVFMRMNRQDYASRVDHKLLKESWDMGSYVHVDHVKGEKHWKNIIGYGAKKGYFDKGKGKQIELPDYVRNSSSPLRRIHISQSENRVWKSRQEVSPSTPPNEATIEYSTPLTKPELREWMLAHLYPGGHGVSSTAPLPDGPNPETETDAGLILSHRLTNGERHDRCCRDYELVCLDADGLKVCQIIYAGLSDLPNLIPGLEYVPGAGRILYSPESEVESLLRSFSEYALPTEPRGRSTRRRIRLKPLPPPSDSIERQNPHHKNGGGRRDRGVFNSVHPSLHFDTPQGIPNPIPKLDTGY